MAILSGTGFKPTWAGGGSVRPEDWLPATKQYARFKNNQSGGIGTAAPSSVSSAGVSGAPTSITAENARPLKSASVSKGNTQGSAVSFSGAYRAPAWSAGGTPVQRELPLATRYYAKLKSGQADSGSYSPLSDVQSIYNYKSSYTNAKNAGDMDSANKYEALARQNYLNLIQNGRGDLAASLHAADVPNASRVLDTEVFDDYSRKYKESADTQAENAYRDALSDIDERRAETDRDYAAKARAGYIQYLKDRNALPQQLKAAGMTGGLSESSGISLANNYGEQAGALERERLSALSGLGREELKARRDMENQKAQTTADLAAKQYENYLTKQAQDFQSALTDKQIAANKDIADKDRAYNYDALKQDDTHFNADTKYKYDAMAQDDAHYNANLGFEKEQAAKNYALDLADRGIVDYLAKEMGKDPNEVYQMLLKWLGDGYALQYDSQYGAKAAYTVPKTSGGSSKRTSSGGSSKSTSSGGGGTGGSNAAQWNAALGAR